MDIQFDTKWPLTPGIDQVQLIESTLYSTIPQSRSRPFLLVSSITSIGVEWLHLLGPLDVFIIIFFETSKALRCECLLRDKWNAAYVTGSLTTLNTSLEVSLKSREISRWARDLVKESSPFTSGSSARLVPRVKAWRDPPRGLLPNIKVVGVMLVFILVSSAFDFHLMHIILWMPIIILAIHVYILREIGATQIQTYHGHFRTT
jgi:hypothetical protein